MPQTYILGNWKMHKTLEEVKSFFRELPALSGDAYFGIAPQAIHLTVCLNNELSIGVQNISAFESGAHTGEISPVSAKDLGANFCLIGHSERRSIYKEDDSAINAKLLKAMELNLLPILCVGETLEERESGKAFDTIKAQLEKGLAGAEIEDANDIVIAYEPVWAIGTGKTATPEIAEDIHAQIRSYLIERLPEVGSEISLLYGGSVKPENVQELLAQENINGALVGGASLKADSFVKLCEATR